MNSCHPQYHYHYYYQQRVSDAYHDSSLPYDCAGPARPEMRIVICSNQPIESNHLIFEAESMRLLDQI